MGTFVKYQQLVRAARRAQKRSHSPYSNFRVGAALLATSGKVYSGCNIESSSFGLTICAERTAIFKAISEGERQFKAIVIVSDAEDFISPCGACRQVLMDFAKDIDVVICDGADNTRVVKISTLLPLPFNDSVIRHA
jgi:cytidine deaminase